MTKSISGDVKIDSLLDSDANLDHPVLSWQTSNSLGTNVDLTFEFMTSMPPGIQESGFSQMNAAQKSAMRDILDMIETFAAITFTERNANLENDIGFGMAALQADGFNTVGIAYQTFQFASSHRFLIESSVFLTNDVNGQDYNAPVPNGEAYSVLIHEAAHALGLDHPFEGITLPSSLDNTRYTIMSYTDGFVGQSEEPSTLMPYDIAALQYLYGRNNSHNAGDTVHDLSVFSDGSIQTIWDASGTDTLSLANVNSAGDINENGLTNAHRLDLGGEIDTGAKVFLYEPTSFENAVGSSFSDLISGNEADNDVFDKGGNDRVELAGGNDYVRVGGGVDYFDGGSGKDYISYYDSANGVTVNLATNTVSRSWAVNDTILNFESVSGSKTGDDLIYGTSGSNTIRTYGGDDDVYAGKGSDKVELGSGNDYVRVGGGKESFDGGTGSDYISYYFSANGIRIDLRDNEVSGSWAVNDTIKNFESASGSFTGHDTMLGTSGNNTFRGYGGNDKLYGRAGSDKLYGGAGSDFLDGGAGQEIDYLYGGADADVFHFDRGEGVDIVKDFENNIDTIELDNFTFAGGDPFGSADQVGSDVVFDFGSNGMLTIENTTIGQLQNDVVLV